MSKYTTSSSIGGNLPQTDYTTVYGLDSYEYHWTCKLRPFKDSAVLCNHGEATYLIFSLGTFAREQLQ